MGTERCTLCHSTWGPGSLLQSHFATLLFQRDFYHSAHLVGLLKEWQWQKIRFENKQKCPRTGQGAIRPSGRRPMAEGWNEINFKALPALNHSSIVGFQHFPSPLSWGKPSPVPAVPLLVPGAVLAVGLLHQRVRVLGPRRLPGEALPQLVLQQNLQSVAEGLTGFIGNKRVGIWQLNLADWEWT